MHPSTRHPWRIWRIWRGVLLALLLLATGAPGWSQSDPPARVAYISALEGSARMVDASNPAPWSAAALNWPVTTGSQLELDAGTRVELDGGWLALRLQGAAAVNVTALDDSTTQVALTSGSLSLRVRELDAGERIEIDTPQLALVAQQPGEYRLDVDPRTGTTRVTVRSGAVTLYGESGQSMPQGAGTQVLVSGRALGLLANGPAPGRDAFDLWVAQRDALEDRSISAQYLSRDMPGYQQLDAYGEWMQDATWGPVWYPNVTVVDWAPYRYGRWTWLEPWGWTWVDDAPWGFAPFHYGRWTQIGPRWAWVPGPRVRRPVYAPALVQFFGAGGDWNVTVGAGVPGTAWFPLAPGEAWRPHYHASDRYLGRINNWGRVPGHARPPASGYFFQHRPGAISVAPQGPLWRPEGGGRRPHYGDGSRLPHGWLQDSRPVAPPAPAHRPGMQVQRPQETPGSRPWGRPYPQGQRPDGRGSGAPQAYTPNPERPQWQRPPERDRTPGVPGGERPHRNPPRWASPEPPPPAALQLRPPRARGASPEPPPPAALQLRPPARREAASPEPPPPAALQLRPPQREREQFDPGRMRGERPMAQPPARPMPEYARPQQPRFDSDRERPQRSFGGERRRFEERDPALRDGR